ncbi:MAG: hypothetical protein JWM44_2532, partial [Bacilli bacterium]|nr:hypothetical protein [Bacilli bacterium]
MTLQEALGDTDNYVFIKEEHCMNPVIGLDVAKGVSQVQ